jgi:hypothetical protein
MRPGAIFGGRGSSAMALEERMGRRTIASDARVRGCMECFSGFLAGMVQTKATSGEPGASANFGNDMPLSHSEPDAQAR